MNLLDILQDIMDDAEDQNGTGRAYADDIINGLEQAGFMIVPIEDPTNLRFGVE